MKADEALKITRENNGYVAPKDKAIVKEVLEEIKMAAEEGKNYVRLEAYLDLCGRLGSRDIEYIKSLGYKMAHPKNGGLNYIIGW